MPSQQLTTTAYFVNMFDLKQLNKVPPAVDDKDNNTSDLAHAHLLSSRVQLHDGVWLVNDNIRKHDTFMVKLSVCKMLYVLFRYRVCITCSCKHFSIIY